MKAIRTAREVMLDNWQKTQTPPSTSGTPAAPSRALNLHTVLDLGNTVFFTFRGRAYGIPPLAWKAGEQILDVWLEAQTFGLQLTPDTIKPYYRTIRRLQKLLWANCRPTGPFRRALRFFRLHPNPFRRATEGEIAELAVFMLGRRMNTIGRVPTETAPNRNSAI